MGIVGVTGNLTSSASASSEVMIIREFYTSWCADAIPITSVEGSFKHVPVYAVTIGRFS